MVIETSSDAPRAMRHGDRERSEQLTADPATRATGTNTATVVRVEAVTAPATSFTEATMSRRGQRVVPGVAALDVLDHHDRVVDHPADRHRHARPG